MFQRMTAKKCCFKENIFCEKKLFFSNMVMKASTYFYESILKELIYSLSHFILKKN